MSAREKLRILVANSVGEDADEYIDDLLHEEAEKIRASSPWASHEATWQRHLLYGMSGETFEAQTTLDALGKAITEVHAKLIDPYVK